MKLKLVKIGLALTVSLLLVASVYLPVQADDDEAEVNLEVEVIPPPERDDGIRRPPTYYLETYLFGLEGSFKTDYKGEVQETIEATSVDGNLTITIPEGTTALGDDGKRLRDLEVVVDENPPAPPENSIVIGLAYDFRPTGATFDPPITFTWTYDLEILTEDVAGLTLAYYDEETAEWIELPSTVDPVAHTITASVLHFTTFAIIGWVPPMPPLPPPIDEEEIEEPELPEEEEEPEIIEPEEEEPVEPLEPEKPEELVALPVGIDWILVGSLIGGFVLLAGLLYWLYKKLRKA